MTGGTIATTTPVSVNGFTIDEAAIAREMQHHPSGSISEARKRAIEALVLQRLLLVEAERQGMAGAAGNDMSVDDPRIAALIEREIKVPIPDAAACRRYYDNNRRKFRAKDQYEARHILLACAPEDFEARDGAKIKAHRIITALQEKPELFGEMAIAYSQCPSRNHGGRLGILARGDTVPEFETYVLSLNDGELCPLPVETRYGVHVIALERKWIGEPLSFEAVQPRIAQYLQAKSYHTALRQYLTVLAGQARIEGAEIAATGSPLVQ